MRCVRIALVFAAMLVMVAASEAQPFPRFAAQPTPLAVLMLNSIDDPTVNADLKLKDEQVKTLVARQKELWDEAYITSPNKFREGNAARTEATNALLKKTLTAEQYKRVTQLGAQSILGGRGFKGGGKDDTPTFRLTTVTPVILNWYPELVAAFKLTDEQKKQLTGNTGGFGRSITMTKEQSDAAKEFLGPIAKTWQAKSDPRIAAQPRQPDGFNLLGAKDVRAELKLTEPEAKAIAALAEKWQKLNNDRFSEISPKEADAQGTVLKTESEKALAALKPEQIARLKQITVQTGGFSGGRFGGTIQSHIEQLYTNATVAKELTVTETQVKEFQAVREAFEKDAIAVLETASAFTATEKKLDDLVAARRTKAEGVLTADQKTKLKELVGAPFTGSTISDSLMNNGPLLQFLETLRTASFGKYTTELTFLARNKSIQEELKMDEKQLKQAADALSDLTTKFRFLSPNDTEAYTKTYAERSKAIAEAMGKLLTEDQAKRFRQIMLQFHEKGAVTRPGARSTAIGSAAVYPGVAEALKLKDEQKKQLIAGDKPAEVLNPDQKSAIQKMLGDSFKGEFLLPLSKGPRSPFPQPSALVQLFLGNDKVAEEALKFSADQSKKLTAAREVYQKAIQDAQPGGGGINDYIAALKAAYDAFDKAVMDLITADQKPRLAQLIVQVDAAASLIATLTAPEMAKMLELTKEQTEQLTTISEEATKLQGLRTTHVSFVAGQKLGLQMRDSADDRMVAVLTDGQKKKWKELTGEPLTGLTKTIPGGFGGFGPGIGGGFGGPGGFGGGGGFGGPFGP